MNAEFNALYADSGRPSIAPERLLRASLIQILYSIHSERQLVQHIDYNLPYRCFVGLEMDAAIRDHSVFTKNRDRLLNETVARSFFGRVLGLAEWDGLVSSEHFTVDGTLIEAWASMKRFVAKDGTVSRRKMANATPRWISKERSGAAVLHSPLPDRETSGGADGR